MIKTSQKQGYNGGFTSGLLFMIKAVGISYILSVIMLTLAAVFAVYRGLGDVGISVLANVVTAIGTAFSGFMAGRHFDSRGLIFGAGSGVIYTVLLCIMGNIVSGSLNFGVSFLTAFLIGLICGAVGGIAGINTKRTKRR